MGKEVQFPVESTNILKLISIKENKNDNLTKDIENESNLVKSIFVKPSNTKDKNRGWDKRYVCVFCQKRFPKLPRHLEDKHQGESEVMKVKALLALPSDSEDTKKLKSKMRLDIIESLRRKGNYNHNIKVLKQGFEELIVNRCPPRETSCKLYLPCLHCLEFYFNKDLHRYVKMCKQKSNVSGKSTNRVQSYSAMLLPTHSDISPYLAHVFETMKVDDVSICLKVDNTIIKYGNVLCKKHLNNDDQTRHISNKLRELGRLLLKMKSKNLVTCFKDILHPKLF